MLSALIRTEHSYPAVLLAEQLVDQRFVHPGPLVLGTTPLKYQRPHQIWTNLSHAIRNNKYLIGLYLIPFCGTQRFIIVSNNYPLLKASLYGVNVRFNRFFE